jgi:hypothetical protein
MKQIALGTREKITLWIGVVMILGAGIYPPWTHASPAYNWLFAKTYGSAKVDLSRLIVEWFLVGVLVLGLYIAPLTLRWSRVRKNEAKSSGMMPTWAFREVVGLPPDPAAPIGKTEWTSEDARNYPFAVELRSGELARFSMSEGAESFRKNHPGLLKQ